MVGVSAMNCTESSTILEPYTVAITLPTSSTLHPSAGTPSVIAGT